MHDSLAETVKWLQSVVRGFFQYHAVPGNQKRLGAFRTAVLRLWLRQIRRRSQRSRWTWDRSLERLSWRQTRVGTWPSTPPTPAQLSGAGCRRMTWRSHLTDDHSLKRSAAEGVEERCLTHCQCFVQAMELSGRGRSRCRSPARTFHSTSCREIESDAASAARRGMRWADAYSRP
jgi:hypothetical protein